MEVDKSVRGPFEHFHDRTEIVNSLKRKQHYASETIVFKTTRRLLDTEIKQQGATTVFYLTWARQHIEMTICGHALSYRPTLHANSPRFCSSLASHMFTYVLPHKPTHLGAIPPV